MRYISLKELHQVSGVNPYNEREELLKYAQKNTSGSFTVQDLSDFLSIQNSQTKVFNSWIEQHVGLKELLLTGQTKILFQDTFKWSEHQSFATFQSYISPFFKIISQFKLQADINEDWKCIFSYLQLMAPDPRTEMEQVLFYQLQKKLDAHFEAIKSTKSVEAFYEEILFLLGDNVFFFLNQLSRNSHGTKVQFTERIISLFQHAFCHAKSANWMLNRLNELDLNEKQKESLAEIRQKLKSGSIRFAFKERSKTQISFRLWLLVGVIAFFLAGGTVLLTMDFSVPPTLIHEGSALRYFSVKERKEIDSVLRTMNVQPEIPEDSYSNYSGVSVALRKPYANEIAESIYSELELEMSLQFQQGFDSSKSISKSEAEKLVINKTKPLLALKIGDEVEINNVSEYDFILIAWEESDGGAVYTGFLQKKSKIKFKLIKGNYFMLVPGLRFVEIPTKQQSNFDFLPAHFENIDYNFEQFVQNPMRFLYPSSGLNKLLIEGKTGEVIYVNDVQSAFSY